MKNVEMAVLSMGIILVLLIAWGYFNIWRSPKKDSHVDKKIELVW
jgi:preprotein translocase subunit YajC